MSNQNTYKPKVWNAFCDSCGFKFKSTDLRLRWDGLMVDNACWEPRQPQDFLRAVVETSNKLPWSRPSDGANSDATFVGPNYATLYVADGYVEDMLGENSPTYFVELT